MDLNSLEDEQLNTKLRKLLGWKEVNGKWWHDTLGDGPPAEFIQLLGRAQCLVWANALLLRPYLSSAVPDAIEEEWRLGQTTIEGDRGPNFNLPAIFQGLTKVCHGEDKEQLRAAKNAHNASIRRVLEKKAAVAESVDAPDGKMFKQPPSQEWLEAHKDDDFPDVVGLKETDVSAENAPGQNELLPCPFCGTSRFLQIENNGIGDYFVICDEGDGEDEGGCGVRTSDVRCEGKQFAADRWNKRAAISVSDGGGSDASSNPNPAPSSSSANAHKSLEEPRA